MRLSQFPNWFEVKLLNGNEVRRLLLQIPPKMRRTAMVKAISAGAGVVKQRAVAVAPVQSGLLAKSLGVRRVRTRDKWTVSYRVQPRKGFKRPILKYNRSRVALTKGQAKRVMAANANYVEYAYPAMYAHFTELGHRMVKRGHAYGHVAGTHWMRRGLDATRAAATRAVADKLRSEIAKL